MNDEPNFWGKKTLTKYKVAIDKQSKQLTKKYKILRNVTSDGQNIQNNWQHMQNNCQDMIRPNWQNIWQIIKPI